MKQPTCEMELWYRMAIMCPPKIVERGMMVDKGTQRKRLRRLPWWVDAASWQSPPGDTLGTARWDISTVMAETRYVRPQ